MKIIVSHASAGAGHSKAGQAVYNYLKEHRSGVTTDIIDVLEKSSRFFRFSYKFGYSFLIKYAPLLWGLGFWVTHCRPLRPWTRIIASFFNRLNTKRFSDFLIRENPDYIVSTHFLPSEIAAHLKIKRKIKSKVVTVITDFGVHPFWVSCGTDIYVAASGLTAEQLVEESVDKSIIRPFGIPVDAKFLGEFNKNQLLAKFNLDPDKFTILVVTGSFGTGPINEITDALAGKVQMMIVCANNRKLLRSLSRRNYPHTRVFGFIDNIQELMAVSDIIVTKPGGLSISESLVMDLFPVFISAIPGQETENIRVLAKYGLGIRADNIKVLKEAVLDLRDHPEKLNAMKERIRRVKKPFAVKDICDALC